MWLFEIFEIFQYPFVIFRSMIVPKASIDSCTKSFR